MNLHAIVSGAISAVNPRVPVTIRVSAGSAINPAGDRVLAYAAPVIVQAQVQALTQADVVHADALSIQGVRRALYVNGEVDGLVRVQNKGGDLVTLPDGTVWLVSEVVEHWPDWTKAIITLQDDSALPSVSAAPAPLPPLIPASSGFGFALYAEADTETPLALGAGVRTQLMMTVDPTKTLNQLRPPFNGFTMWDGSLIRTANVNDVLSLRIAMDATAAVAGGNLKLEAAIAGTTTILDTKNEPLSDQASTTERVFFDMLVYAGAAFVADGVALYLTSDVPVSVVSETVLIVPQSAGP